MFSHSYLIVLCILCFFYNLGYGNKPEIHISVTPVSCYNASDGEIQIDVDSVNAPLNLQVSFPDIPNTLVYAFERDTFFTLTHLSASVFHVRVTSDNTELFSEQFELSQPEELTGNSITLVKAPSSETSCDAILRVNPGGGNPPYTYVWSENAKASSQPEIRGICMGIYRCEINDSKNCGPVYVSIPLFKNTIEKYLTQ